MTATASVQKQLREQLCILIVEDSAVFREILKAALPNAHTIYVAADVREGWEMYLDKSPGIVFLDIHLPGGNGHDLARMIKKQNPSTYIVMATGSRHIVDKMTAAYNHVDGFIVKPFQKKEIAGCIEKCLAQRRRSMAVGS